MTRKAKTTNKARTRRPESPKLGLYGEDPKITAVHERALHEAIARYAHRPEVTGIDVGFKVKGGRRTPRVSVRLHVREKVPRGQLAPRERFAARIHGVPVDVLQAAYHDETGLSGAPGENAWEMRTTAATQLRPGLGLSHVRGPAGTLGLMLVDRTSRRKCLLGAGHVLAPGVNYRPGDPILQPAREDGGADTAEVAQLARVHRETDAAIAWLSAGRSYSPRPLGAGVDLSTPRFPRLGDVLEKSGRTTGVTRALVDGLGVFEGLRFAMRLVPISEGYPQRAISRPGDSGAIWYDPTDGRAVGLHGKGLVQPNNAVEVAVASSVMKVMEFLGLQF
jgi:hypothetical protein